MNQLYIFSTFLGIGIVLTIASLLTTFYVYFKKKKALEALRSSPRRNNVTITGTDGTVIKISPFSSKEDIKKAVNIISNALDP
jgi:hypothetical protein